MVVKGSLHVANWHGQNKVGPKALQYMLQSLPGDQVKSVRLSTPDEEEFDEASVDEAYNPKQN